MNEIFLKIVTMSMSASWLVLAVLIFRFILKNAPKWVYVLLWGIVAVRLVCPFTIESHISLIPDFLGSGELISQWGDDYIGDIDIHYPDSAYYDVAIDAGREPVADGEGGYYVVTKHDRLTEPSTVENTVIPVLSTVWLTGVFALLLYTAFSYFHLRYKLAAAVLYKENIYQSENVVFPFVLGVVKPKIYLPFKLDGQRLEYVTAHEKAHIRRKDHWWKPFGFLLLALHWFNPLMWLAYILLCRDIELACDEKVIKRLGSQQRADYTQALVSFSVNRRRVAACPLAFGEAGVKERVKSVMHYKKPTFWMILISAAACIVIAVCFLTNPKQDRFSLRIVIPAGSQEDFVYADEEISPLGKHITITSGDGLGDAEVVLKPVQVKTETAYEPEYLTPGMPVKMAAEKGAWFKIGVHVQNDTDQDKIVYVNVDNIAVRTEAMSATDLGQYRTEYIGDATRVDQIAQLLPYPKDYRYSSIRLQTDTEPYELTVFVTGKDHVQREDFEGCAAAAFDLIGNMGVISFGRAGTDDMIASFTRNGGSSDSLESVSSDVDTRIAGLLDIIQASPAASSNPGDYIDEHKEEYQELVSYGQDALRYCFSEFLSGGQTDLRGHIMRAVIDDIAPEASLRLEAETGQEYFDAWKNAAISIRNRNELEWIEKHQPAVYLLLQMMDEA